MTRSSKKQPNLAQIFNLINQLSPEEGERLMQELKIQDFRREIQKGNASANRGELKPATEVINKLRTRAQSRA